METSWWLADPLLLSMGSSPKQSSSTPGPACGLRWENLSTPRQFPPGVLTATGSVLVPGGVDPSGSYLASAEVYSTPAQVSLSSSSVDFGSVLVGNSAGQTLSLSNVGGTELTAITYVVPDQFVLDSGTTCGTTLRPASECVLELKFAPTTSGPVQTTFRIEDNAADSPQTISLIGTSVDPGNGNGGAGNAGGPPSASSTPELDSFALLGSGVLALASYGLTHRRARH